MEYSQIMEKSQKLWLRQRATEIKKHSEQNRIVHTCDGLTATS